MEKRYIDLFHKDGHDLGFAKSQLPLESGSLNRLVGINLNFSCKTG